MMAQMTPALARGVAMIRADNRSGAAAVAAAAVGLLADAHRESQRTVAAVASAVCEAQPSMAPVWNAAALALRADGGDALVRYGQLLDRAPRALARVAVSTLLAGHTPGTPLTVLTVSASDSVRRALLDVSRRCPLRVLCAEGRPLLEGRRLAAALAADGVATTLCTDAAVSSVGQASHAVVVGADAVTPDWFLNKCGTHQTVEVAAARGMSVYVVASRDKLIHPLLAPRLTLSAGAPSEVWADSTPGVEIANPYFERIPIGGLTGIITDIGLVGSASVEALAQALVTTDDAERLISLL